MESLTYLFESSPSMFHDWRFFFPYPDSRPGSIKGDRILASKMDQWKELGIYDLVVWSRDGAIPPVDINFFASALSFWSTFSNAFIFRFGTMTVTLSKT